MKEEYKTEAIPRSRIATFDVMSIGTLRHHVSALLEFDVTDSRKKLRELKRSGVKVSFNGWIIKAISSALEKHAEATGYLLGKKKIILFNDINVSFVVEKEINGKRVPIPMVIEKTNEKSAEEITIEIENAGNQVMTEDEIVLRQKPKAYERLYYSLPGFARRMFWRYLLKHPKTAFGKMGNVSVTSPGTAGKINGWFIHKAVHPVSFGIGSVINKPTAVNDVILIREILKMTVLFDHDVIDGAPMVRFLKDLTEQIEKM